MEQLLKIQFSASNIDHALLTTALILLEVALVAFVALDHHWEKDLPFDPTGELYRIRAFIENNVEVCKWVGISLVVIQVLSLLLAMILRAMVSIRREDSDIEGGYDVSDRTPLLNPQLSQTYGSIKGIRTHSDSWSSRMREKVSL
ncbi:unnamed protein product [Ilex paraguariensis]|uniref:Uncharacterized protein n=1 Tax=Ilex paraguariensis TaxID=185542 RepID=A0ABC8T240_9AQUA